MGQIGHNVQVKGVGLDATCSLVVLDAKREPMEILRDDRRTNPLLQFSGQPLSISIGTQKDSSRVWDIIMWMDHRAMEQADRINATKHDRLKHVGRQISPEMEPPKLLWLKENKPDTWKEIEHVMDLADFLTFKATRSLIRSVSKDMLLIVNMLGI